MVRAPESERAFIAEFGAMVSNLRAFTSPIIFVLFNEGWGQANTLETVALARKLL